MLIKQLTRDDSELAFVKSELSSFRDYYENFNEWFDSSVKPNVGVDRHVFLATDGVGSFAGAMILKNTKDEKKICTLFVSENSRFNHIGGDFLSIASRVLMTNELPISFSESVKNCFFSNKKFNFVLQKEAQNAYKQGITEYFGYIRFHESNEAIRLAKIYANGLYRLAVLIERNKDIMDAIKNNTFNNVDVSVVGDEILLTEKT